MKKILKIKNRIISILKICIYKIIYNKQLQVNNLLKSYILENSKIVIENNGMLIFKTSPICRENVKFNINGFLEIGENVFINKDSSINVRGKMKIGDNCLLGENVKIYDHDHIFYLDNRITESKKFTIKDIIIGNNVWIGSNVTILKGVSIGDNCVIAAGSIITKSIKKNTLHIQNKDIKE